MSSDRLGQVLSGSALRAPDPSAQEGAADSAPAPVALQAQAPTDVSAAGIVLENPPVSEGVASAGLPPQVTAALPPPPPPPSLPCLRAAGPPCKPRSSCCVCFRRHWASSLASLCLRQLVSKAHTALPRASRERRQVSWHTAPTASLLPCKQCALPRAVPDRMVAAGAWGTQDLKASLCRMLASARTHVVASCCAGLHDGGTAGGSTYGFGETGAGSMPMDIHQPGTASAQVCGRSRSRHGSNGSTDSGRRVPSSLVEATPHLTLLQSLCVLPHPAAGWASRGLVLRQPGRPRGGRRHCCRHSSLQAKNERDGRGGGRDRGHGHSRRGAGSAGICWRERRGTWWRLK